MPASTVRSSGAASTSQKRTAPPAIAAPERSIGNVVLGDILFQTWYPSFYPEASEGGSGIGHSSSNSTRQGDNEIPVASDRLYVCRCCFKYSQNLTPYLAHSRICEAGEDGKGYRMPGQMIYEHETVQVWEVDGETEKLFCQNLSLFAKLFLDNKSVFYDVSSFLYYLLVYVPKSPRLAKNIQIVGFFSKEKMSWDNNNLACILVFPPWQRKGFGKILMGISYEVSKREGRMGGPEKPLSDLGRRSYISYWSCQIASTILHSPLRKPLTIRSISQQTYILPEDVTAALQEMDILKPQNETAKPGRKRNDGALPVSKARVRAWVEQHHASIQSAIDPSAFVEGWEPLPSWEGDAAQ